jgi:transposase-like protein
MSSTQEPSHQEQETTKVINTKRKSYSVSFKIEAIKFADESSNRKAAKHYGIDESVIQRWKKLRKKLEQIPNKVRKTIKKQRPAKRLALEAHLKSWIISQRADGRQVSGTLVLQEARKSAVLIDLTNFKGSSKWIFNFMK